ncbi:hypothetical protein U1Q18_005170 [Sarracenia purpurea var. burkii]
MSFCFADYSSTLSLSLYVPILLCFIIITCHRGRIATRRLPFNHRLLAYDIAVPRRNRQIVNRHRVSSAPPLDLFCSRSLEKENGSLRVDAEILRWDSIEFVKEEVLSQAEESRRPKSSVSIR